MIQRQRVGGVRRKTEIKLSLGKEKVRSEESQGHFPQLNVRAVHLESCQNVDNDSGVREEAWESAFLTSYQVIWMLLVHRLHFL